MAMKEFSSTSVRRLREIVEEELSDLCKRENIKIEIFHTNYKLYSAEMRLQISIVDDSGEIAHTDSENEFYNNVASRLEIPFTGNFLNSLWVDTDGKVFKVVEYNRKNSKYPIIFEKNGTRYKTSAWTFKTGAKQLVKPDKDAFILWCNMDPDDDCVRESDVEIWDRVQLYMENALSDSDYTAFMEAFNEIASKIDSDEKILDTLYSKFENLGAKGAIDYMKYVAKHK